MPCQASSFKISIDSFSLKRNQREDRPHYTLIPKISQELGLKPVEQSTDSSRQSLVRYTLSLHSDKENPTPFDLDAVVSGYFDLNKDSTEEEAEKFLETEGVRIVFPYVRALVASLTSDALMAPLQLPLLVNGLKEEKHGWAEGDSKTIKKGGKTNGKKSKK